MTSFNETDQAAPPSAEKDDDSLPLFEGADDSRNDISDVGLLLLANEERLVKNPQPLSSSSHSKAARSQKQQQQHLLPHERAFANVATHFTGSDGSFSGAGPNVGGDFDDDNNDEFFVPKEGTLKNMASAPPTGRTAGDFSGALRKQKLSATSFGSLADRNVAASTTQRFFGAPSAAVTVAPPTASVLARQNEQSSSRNSTTSRSISRKNTDLTENSEQSNADERSGSRSQQGSTSRSHRSTSRAPSMSGDASDEDGAQISHQSNQSRSKSRSSSRAPAATAALPQHRHHYHQDRHRSLKKQKEKKTRMQYEEEAEEETMFDFQERIRKKVRLEEDNEKREMLLMFWEKQTQEGAQVPKKFFELGLKSDLLEMRWWYYKLLRDTRINDAVANMKSNLVQGARGALFLNNIIGNPLGLRLDAEFTKELQHTLNTKADRHLRDHIKTRCGVSGPKSKPWTHIAREVWECGFNYHQNKLAMEAAEARQKEKQANAAAAAAAAAASTQDQSRLQASFISPQTQQQTYQSQQQPYASPLPQFQPDKKPLHDVFRNMTSEMRQAPIPATLAPPNIAAQSAALSQKPTDGVAVVAERLRQRVAQQDMQTRMQQQQIHQQEQILLEKQRILQQEKEKQQQQQPNSANREPAASAKNAASATFGAASAAPPPRFQPARSAASTAAMIAPLRVPPPRQSLPLQPPSRPMQPATRTNSSARLAQFAPFRASAMRDLSVAAPMFPNQQQQKQQQQEQQQTPAASVQLLRQTTHETKNSTTNVPNVNPSVSVATEKHPLEVELANLRLEREREMMLASSRVPLPEADNQTLESLMGTLEAHYRADPDTQDLGEDEKSQPLNMPTVPHDDKLSDMMSMIGDFTAKPDAKVSAPRGRPTVTNLDDILRAGKSTNASNRLAKKPRARIVDDEEDAKNEIVPAGESETNPFNRRMLEIEEQMNLQNEQQITGSTAASSTVTPTQDAAEKVAPSTPTRAPLLVAKQGRNKSGGKRLTFSTPTPRQ